MSLTTLGVPQPTLAWTFESSNVDYITGLAPNLSTSGTYAAPTGGTITTVSGKRIHTFTSVGTTSITFLVPVTAEVLVVAGGGGGGGNNSGAFAGGGGGAGEVYYSASYAITPGTYTVTVGDGGLGGTGTTVEVSDGQDSQFGSTICNGGGGGGNGYSVFGRIGNNGGSGGGGARENTGGSSVKTAGGQGNAGGTSTGVAGAGGGGAGSVGANQTNTDTGTATGSAGGSGVSYSISGSSVIYGAGGKGGDRTNNTNGANGATNRGNGGGGGGANNTSTASSGGKGGSGIVVISYNAALYPAPTYVTGKYGQAISFNNTLSPAGADPNCYVTYDLSSFGLHSNSAAMSLWLESDLTYPVNTGNPFYVNLQGSSYNGLFTPNATSNISFRTGSAPAVTVGNVAAQTGVWNHYCTVFSNVGASASNTISYYYVNGSLIGNANNARQSFTTLNLGCQNSGSNGALCSIDDLRLFNTALTVSQIQSIYQAQGMPSRGVALNANGTPYGVGGTVTTVSGNRIHTYTTVGSDTFTCYQSGYVQLLVVAGGGGGGANGNNALSGGGGGAGEYYYSASYLVTPGTYTVTVGAGGTGGIAAAGDGGDGGASVFGSLSANGGGGGSGGGVLYDARPGGSGGGAGRSGAGVTTFGGAPVTTAGGLGNKGGDNTSGSNFSGAGGGGSGSAGTNASASGTTPVSGGSGTNSTISGASVTYASGGTGGARSGTYTPADGTANQGNGGAGAPAGGTAGSNARNGGAGGSGIVILAYPTTVSVNSQPSMVGTPLFTQLSQAATSSAVGAFSLRAVNGTTARAVNVRNGTTSATADFYADRLGNLLTAPVTGQTLANWLGGATGYVTTWYDQSGAGNHATQTTAANQPVIQRATKGPGYSVLFNGASSQVLRCAASTYSLLNGTNYSVFVTERRNAAGTDGTQGGYLGLGNTSGAKRGLITGYWNAQTNMEYSHRGDNLDNTIAAYAGASEPIRYTSFIYSASTPNKRVFINASQLTNTNNATDLAATAGEFTMGKSFGTANAEYYYGEFYEVLVFTSSLYDLDGTTSINQIYQNQLSLYGT